jgi:hypothetical protein
LVKIAKHVQFDEGMSYLPLDAVPPNVQYLLRVQEGQPLPPELTNDEAIQVSFTGSPFPRIVTKTFLVRCTQDNFGISLGTDTFYQRVYVRGIARTSTVSKGYSTTKAANNAIRGAYIHSIAGKKVFSVEDAVAVFADLRDRRVTSFSMDFAPE